MRIFIVGTGRCGTKTMSVVCSHIKGYTVGHESFRGKLWHEFIDDIPDNHVECSYSLSFYLPYLATKYPDSVFIHLIRNRKDCTESLAETCPMLLTRYSELVLIRDSFEIFDKDINKSLLQIAESYYDAINGSISSFISLLNQVSNTHCSGTFHIGSGMEKRRWAFIWDFLKLDGDLDAALKEFDVKHNARNKEQI